MGYGGGCQPAWKQASRVFRTRHVTTEPSTVTAAPASPQFNRRHVGVQWAEAATQQTHPPP